jgi:hypothetical protein
MTYSFSSPHYQIPAPGLGDTLQSVSEQRAAQIMDAQLFGGILAHSGGHGVFREGNYIAVFGSGNNSSVTIVPNAPAPALDGFIQQEYFNVPNPITWPNLLDQTTNKLYAQSVETGSKSTLQFGSVNAISLPVGYGDPANAVLVAYAITSGTTIAINPSPPNKIKILTVAQHAAINQNPHGTPLFQDQLVTSGITVFGNLTGGIISAQQVGTSGLVILGPITFGSDVQINGNLLVSGTSSFSGLVTSATNWNANNIVTQNLTVSGLATFWQNLTFVSGVAIDGIDPSTLPFLINGSNADYLGPTTLGHTHTGLSGVTQGYNFACTGRLLEFQNSGLSFTEYDNVHVYNRYLFFTSGNMGPAVIDDRIPVPADWIGEDRNSFIKIWNKLDNKTASNIGVQAYDTVGVQIPLLPNLLFNEGNTWVRNVISISGTQAFTFNPGDFYTARYTLQGRTNQLSGVGPINIYLGEGVYPYRRGS